MLTNAIVILKYFPFPPVGDFFGKWAVSRHVLLITWTLLYNGEIESHRTYSAFLYFVAALWRGQIYTCTFVVGSGSHLFYDSTVSGIVDGYCCTAQDKYCVQHRYVLNRGSEKNKSNKV